MFSTLLELAEQKYGEGTYLTFHKGDKWSIRNIEGDVLDAGDNYFQLLDIIHDKNSEEDYTTNYGFATYTNW